MEAIRTTLAQQYESFIGSNWKNKQCLTKEERAMFLENIKSRNRLVRDIVQALTSLKQTSKSSPIQLFTTLLGKLLLLVIGR
jgi:hypothetical protein